MSWMLLRKKPTHWQRGLVGYWRLDEASGVRYDVGPNRLHLTDNNTVTQLAGKVRYAGQFTNTNTEYLSRADEPALRMGDRGFTCCAWVFQDSVAGSNTIVSKNDATGDLREWRLQFKEPAARYDFRISPDGTLGSAVQAQVAFAVAPSTWYWLACWYDPVADLLSLSVDNGTPGTAALAGGVFGGAAPFRIGAVELGGVPGDLMNGRIDEVLLWKGRILTAAERLQIYNLGLAGRPVPLWG